MLYKCNMSRDRTDGVTLKALANPLRREILDLLRVKSRTTG